MYFCRILIKVHLSYTDIGTLFVSSDVVTFLYKFDKLIKVYLSYTLI